MADIVRIVIKGASGYCCFDDAFNDKVTLTNTWAVMCRMAL